MLWNKDRRTSTARRYGSRLYIERHREDQLDATYGLALCRALVAPRWLRLAALNLWPLGPVEHELFASGGDRALGVDSHSVWGG